MDPVANPFTPGPGAHPHELHGRDEHLALATTALERARRCLPVRHLAFIGLRGAGKTVLLHRIRCDSEARGVATLYIDASEPRSLPALLLPELRQTLLMLRRDINARKATNSAGATTQPDETEQLEAAARAITKAFGALSSFANAHKGDFPDIAVPRDAPPLKAAAETGSLAFDLRELLAYASMAAKRAGTALAVFVDEAQCVPPALLATLVMAARGTTQRRLPLLLTAAGLPQAIARLRTAIPNLPYLMEMARVDPLTPDDARSLLTTAAQSRGVTLEITATDAILERACGSPYFLHEWGKHTWNAAAASPITRADVEQASAATLAALDTGIYRVGLAGLTKLERAYLRAMAEAGGEECSSSAVAETLGRPTTALSAVRGNLIDKGLIWSPRRGLARFTAPLHGEHLQRRLPGGGLAGDGWGLAGTNLHNPPPTLTVDKSL